MNRFETNFVKDAKDLSRYPNLMVYLNTKSTREKAITLLDRFWVFCYECKLKTDTYVDCLKAVLLFTTIPNRIDGKYRLRLDGEERGLFLFIVSNHFLIMHPMFRFDYACLSQVLVSVLKIELLGLRYANFNIYSLTEDQQNNIGEVELLKEHKWCVHPFSEHKANRMLDLFFVIGNSYVYGAVMKGEVGEHDSLFPFEDICNTVAGHFDEFGARLLESKDFSHLDRLSIAKYLSSEFGGYGLINRYGKYLYYGAIYGKVVCAPPVG